MDLTKFAHWRVTVGYLFALFYLILAKPTSLFFFVLGIEVAIFGLIFRIWAAGYLHKSVELTVCGPYGYVRHPLYLGSFLLGCGFCIASTSFHYWIRSIVIWSVFVLGFSIFYLPQMFLEEKGLEKTFGEKYHHYSKKVPRFLPNLSRYKSEKISSFSYSLYRKNIEYLALFGFVILVLILTVRYLYGEESSVNEKIFSWRRIENKSFDINEKLLFLIKWGIIPAGHATLEVPEKVMVNERSAYRIISRAWSNSLFDVLYKVRDHNESLLDIESLCSLGYEKHIREGRYSKDEKVVYDQENGLAHIEGDKTVVPIPAYVLDILSGLYFLRTQDIKLSDSYFLDVNTGEKNWQLEVKVLNHEKVKVPLGEFNCWLIEPFLKQEGIFQHKGRVLIWLTADEKKIPVLMRTKIPFGSIVAELVEIKRDEVNTLQ